ncbi:MAG: FAD-dependent tricarballylate dehydrogenase TcuA [Betaproteobacteria bacterium]|nr:FAD-dependent tricarballylate dehydrogenase TcuA [Betaproteobacteria bacterium]
MPEETFHYDVLVVGTGNAACSAALSALEKTPRVGMLEKAPRRDRGGNSALTVLMRFAFNGIDDLRPLIRNFSEAEMRPLLDGLPHRTEAELWDEIMRVTNNQSDQQMLQVHVTESLKTVHWLAGKGHDWSPATIRDDNVVTMNGGGPGLQKRNFAILEQAGVSFHYETAATALIQDQQGRVTGVRALTPAGFATFTAKSVVLACGSFEANPEMRARYLGPGWDMIRLRGVPFNTGDGLRMALDIGAMPHGSWTTCHASPQDINLPVFTVPSAHSLRDSLTRYMYPWGIMVNTRGERFVDEASDTRGRTYAAMGRSILFQPGGIAFQILDAKIRKMNLYTPNYEKATAAKASTLEKLAEELELDAAKLVTTIREFNAAVQPGKYNPDRHQLDGKCTAGINPPKSNYALEIDEPPFEAFPVRCGMTFAFGGLKIDPKTAQVQHVAGRPIGGLYAAGEMAGGLWVGNYASGSGMMAGATFGRIAGAHAAGAALRLSRLQSSGTR